MNFQAGTYEWVTYEEAYDAAVRIGSAMRSRGVNPVTVLPILTDYTMYYKIYVVNLTGVSCITRVTVVAYMDPIVLNG